LWNCHKITALGTNTPHTILLTTWPVDNHVPWKLLHVPHTFKKPDNDFINCKYTCIHQHNTCMHLTSSALLIGCAKRDIAIYSSMREPAHSIQTGKRLYWPVMTEWKHIDMCKSCDLHWWAPCTTYTPPFLQP